MGRMDGKIVLITGAARGQGRSHAVTLAREGADIIALDICETLPTVGYPLADEADLAETQRLVEELDRRCLTIKADVRDRAACQAAAENAIAEFGRIDTLVINHGIAIPAMWDGTTDDAWEDTISTNLTGVWRIASSVIPHMVDAGNGGSIIITASTAGLMSMYGLVAYTSAKHGVIGLMRCLSAELAPHSIRVNCICPTNCATPMFHSDMAAELFTGRVGAKVEDMAWPAQTHLLLPVPWVEAQDISNGVLYLASDDARYVTGTALPVDGGTLNQPPGIPPLANEKLAELGLVL